jgi:hypothetical protein
MFDPRQAAARLLGAIEWQNEVSGFCKCPGAALHTSHNGKKDCRVNVDGAPTIFCFHASCAGAVAEANRRLRRELGAASWELRLPSGQVLRNGDLLKCGVRIGECGMEIVRREENAVTPRREDAEEKLVLETLRVNTERSRRELFEFFRWPFAQILEESPLLVAERDPEDQFRTWLKLWPACSRVWIGEKHSSGSPWHRTHFRPVSEWYQIGPVMGNYTCGSAFKAGTYCRSNENIEGHRFLVVESDTVAKDEIGAVFTYLNQRLKYNLHAIVDTAGKSLHGWFDAPPNPVMENRLKAGLKALGCDDKLFTRSQPVRVPGAFRDGRLQRLVWLRDGRYR